MPTVKKYIEHQHQVAVFQWIRHMQARYPEFRFAFSIPNGLLGKLTPAQRARARAEGYRAGPSDIFWPLVIPRSRAGLWIEQKVPEKRSAKFGGLTDQQLEFRVHVIAEGYEHHVCYDCEETIAVIKDYHSRYREARRLDVPRKTNRTGAEDARTSV